MILRKIEDAFPKMSKSEQKVAKYVLEHPSRMETISLDDASDIIGVSQPTILRMFRTVGYQGFKEAKVALVEERVKGTGKSNEPLRWGMTIGREDQIEDIPARVIRNTIHLLEDSLQAISAKSLEEAVKAIKEAKRVSIFSVENSNAVAMDLHTKLMYLGINSVFNEDSYLQKINATHLQKGDVAIGISYTGTSINTVDVLGAAKKAGATTIAITNFLDTPLVKKADIVILTSNHQLLYGDDIFSRTVHLAVVDMLYLGLMIEDYDHSMKVIKDSSMSIQKNKY